MIWLRCAKVADTGLAPGPDNVCQRWRSTAASPHVSPLTAPRPLAFLTRDQSLWFGDDQHGPRRQVTHGLPVRDGVWAPSGDAVALSTDQNSQAAAIAALGTGSVLPRGPGSQPN